MKRWLFLIGLSLGLSAASAAPDEAGWKALAKPGAIVLFRHATAPGGGDPPGFVLSDCSTQRNLDEAGRAQAQRLGERVRARQLKVEAVLSSQWCRTRETAQLAFPGLPQDAPEFNSFFANRDVQAQQTAAARKRLLDWRGSGVLVVVTHQVNITAITGYTPQSGEGVVLHRKGRDLIVAGTIAP